MTVVCLTGDPADWDEQGIVQSHSSTQVWRKPCQRLSLAPKAMWLSCLMSELQRFSQQRVKEMTSGVSGT